MPEDNQHPHAEAYGRVIEMLGQARTYAGIELEAPGLNFIRTQIDADLKRIQQKLQMMGGGNLASAPIAAVIGTDANVDQPVTHILGQKVNFRKPIQSASTEVGQSEKDQFLARRDAFLEQLPVLSDEDVLQAIKLPGAAPIIRNIARKAGLQDYKEADLNIEFVERIRKGLEQQQYEKEQVDKADAGASALKQDQKTEIEEQTLPSGLANLYPDQQTVTPEVSGLPVITTDAPAAPKPEEPKGEEPKAADKQTEDAPKAGRTKKA